MRFTLRHTGEHSAHTPFDTGNIDGHGVILTGSGLGKAIPRSSGSQEWTHPIPETVVWCPLLVALARRTWAVWPAECRNRYVAHLIASFEWCSTDSA